MRIFLLALAVAVLVLPAPADAAGRRHRGGAQTTEKKPKVDEKAYGNALSSLPDKKYDPWGGMR